MRKVLSILILFLLFTVLFPGAKPGGYGSYPPPNYGDWVITNETLVENETLVLNGNLIVENGGNLTLRNVTLKMDCAENGSYHIEVQQGGAMYILDGSNITSNTLDGEHRFNFWIRKGANLKMVNSELHECGYHYYYWKLEVNGLYIEADNIQISYSLFSNNYYSIILKNASHGNITNTIMRNNSEAIYLYDSENNIISNNQLYNNHGGIGLTKTVNSTVVNNTISNNFFGCSIWGRSSNNILSNNTFLNNTFNFDLDIITSNIDATFNIDTSNTINGAPIYYLFNQKNSEISPQTGYEKIGFLAIVNSENLTICNLSFQNNFQGLLLINSTNCKIYNISATDNGRGIEFFGSSYNQVNNCDLENNYFGIMLEGNSNNNTILNCKLINSIKMSIKLARSSKNIIHNCSISGVLYGIYIRWGCENNTIQKCNISNHKEYGVFINSISNNNTIYFNNFISNGIHAIDNGSGNKWDNGILGGNYWDDYIGYDNGENCRPKVDGIGDTKLPHLGLDNYPFKKENGWVYYTPSDIDEDGLPDLIDSDIDDDGFSNEDDAYPYDKDRWRIEEEGSNWTIILGAMILLTIGVIILGIVITLLSRKKRED